MLQPNAAKSAFLDSLTGPVVVRGYPLEVKTCQAAFGGLDTSSLLLSTSMHNMCCFCIMCCNTVWCSGGCGGRAEIIILFLSPVVPTPLLLLLPIQGGAVMHILLIAYHKLIGGLKNGIAHVAQGLQSVKFLSL